MQLMLAQDDWQVLVMPSLIFAECDDVIQIDNDKLANDILQHNIVNDDVDCGKCISQAGEANRLQVSA